jgi:hypothetical protein
MTSRPAVADWVQHLKGWIPEDVCKQTVKELKKHKEDFITHSFYNNIDNSYTSYDKELSIGYTKTTTYDFLMQRTWEALKEYTTNYGNDCWGSWAGYSAIRFNKYDKNTQMKKHCDHIHSMFDGNRKGIPICTILGSLNNNYSGGEFIMFQDTEIKMEAGDVLVFPSNFMYPHTVQEITKGQRYSWVSWCW